MAQGYFIQNTIFTDYALNKINEYLYHNIELHENTLVNKTEDNLEFNPETSVNSVIENTEAPPLPFNFTKVIISDQFSALTTDTKKLANEVYELPVTKVEMTSDSIFTIHSSISADIIDLKIWQLGIYETIDGEDKLFAFGNLDTYKPNTDYELIINLEFNLETLQFYKGKLNLEIREPEHVSIAEGQKVSYTFADISEYLKFTISRNKEALIGDRDGFYPIQESFNEEKTNKNINKCFMDVWEYNNTLNSKFGEYLNDTFMFQDENILDCTISNLHNDDSKLTVVNGEFESNNDTIKFGKNGGTLMLIGKYINDSSIILNKVNKTTKEYNFKIEMLGNILTVTINGGIDSYLKYTLEINNIEKMYNNEMSYIITSDNSSIYCYINGELQEGIIERHNFVSPVSGEDMIISNSISDSSVYSKLQKTNSIYFFNKYFNAGEVKELSRIHNYLI